MARRREAAIAWLAATLAAACATVPPPAPPPPKPPAAPVKSAARSRKQAIAQLRHALDLAVVDNFDGLRAFRRRWQRYGECEVRAPGGDWTGVRGFYPPRLQSRSAKQMGRAFLFLEVAIDPLNARQSPERSAVLNDLAKGIPPGFDEGGYEASVGCMLAGVSWVLAAVDRDARQARLRNASLSELMGVIERDCQEQIRAPNKACEAIPEIRPKELARCQKRCGDAAIRGFHDTQLPIALSVCQMESAKVENVAQDVCTKLLDRGRIRGEAKARAQRLCEARCREHRPASK